MRHKAALSATEHLDRADRNWRRARTACYVTAAVQALMVIVSVGGHLVGAW